MMSKSSVYSPPSPPSPTSEGIRKHLPNMEGKPDKTIVDMHSMLTLYESFIEKHSSIDSAASRLSPVIGHIKNDPDHLDRFLDVSNWESTGWDTVTERLENAPKLNSLATQEYLKTQNP
ncbi:hypothetical protein L1887_38881 [Cichorium endivia]|nr:hypothetical protein L1887_38881 [Cichorium endivia]